MLYDGALKFNALSNLTAPILQTIGNYMQIVKNDNNKPITSQFVYDQIRDRGLINGAYTYWILCRYVANKNNLASFLDVGTTAVALIGVADTLNVIGTGDSRNQPLGNRFLNAEQQKRKRKTAGDRLAEDFDDYWTKSNNWFSTEDERNEAADNVRISAKAALIEALLSDEPPKKKQQSGW